MEARPLRQRSIASAQARVIIGLPFFEETVDCFPIHLESGSVTTVHAKLPVKDDFRQRRPPRSPAGGSSLSSIYSKRGQPRKLSTSINPWTRFPQSWLVVCARMHNPSLTPASLLRRGHR